MKLKLIVVCLFFCNNLLFCQSQPRVYQPRMLYFYYQYDNIVYWNNFENCDSTEVIMQGAFFEKRGIDFGVVRVGRGTITTKIFLNGYLNDKIVSRDSIEILAGPIPIPNVYVQNKYIVWSNISILGIEKLNSDIIRNWTGFHITNNRSCPINFVYEVGAWSIIVDGKEFKGKGEKLTEELINALANTEEGDKVMLYDITALIPSINHSRRISLKSEFIIK